VASSLGADDDALSRFAARQAQKLSRIAEEIERAVGEREVLPGPPARPKLTKLDWQSLLQTLTGVDPMRCEICGQHALHLVEEVAPLSERQHKEPESATAMNLLLISPIALFHRSA
jgi:hypothetical protein